jgi:hypothetical protein
LAWLRGRATQNASSGEKGERGEGTGTECGTKGKACPGEEPIALCESNQHHRRQQQCGLEVGEDRGPECEGKDDDPPWGWAVPHDPQERPDQGQDDRLQQGVHPDVGSPLHAKRVERNGHCREKSGPAEAEDVPRQAVGEDHGQSAGTGTDESEGSEVV